MVGMRSDSAASTRQQETDWIHRIATGERQAFESLFQAYVRRLASYVYRMIGDWEAAQEVTNDVMVTVWKEAKRFQGRSQPSTWIFGIAHHKALNELRRRKRHALDELEKAGHLPATGPDPEQEATHLDLQNRLKQALQQLSPEHREVIHMTFFLQMPYREIAEALDCPLNTVKTRMFHAKKKLQPILRKLSIRGQGQ